MGLAAIHFWSVYIGVAIGVAIGFVVAALMCNRNK